MLAKKQLLILLPLILILATLLYLLFTSQGDSNIISDPRVVYESGVPYITAQFRNPTDSKYQNLNLQINILESWRNVSGVAQAKTDAVLPGITWFFKSPIALFEGKPLPAGTLNCRSVSPYKDGEKLVINCQTGN